MKHHRERFRKLTFQALALHQSEWRRANAWNVSFLNLSQWWFITFINSFDKTKFLFYFHTAIDAILSEIWLPPTRTSPLFSAMKILCFSLPFQILLLICYKQHHFQSSLLIFDSIMRILSAVCCALMSNCITCMPRWPSELYAHILIFVSHYHFFRLRLQLRSLYLRIIDGNNGASLRIFLGVGAGGCSYRQHFGIFEEQSSLSLGSLCEDDVNSSILRFFMVKVLSTLRGQTKI